MQGQSTAATVQRKPVGVQRAESMGSGSARATEIKYARIVDAIKRRVPQRKIAAMEGVSESLVCRIDALEHDQLEGSLRDFGAMFSDYALESEREFLASHRRRVSLLIDTLQEMYKDRMQEIYKELREVA